jgi:hypothetical protein
MKLFSIPLLGSFNGDRVMALAGTAHVKRIYVIEIDKHLSLDA